jgi:ribosomal-protein-alanine N-acetyltransferase
MVELKDTHDLVGTIDVSPRFITHGSCGIGYCYSDKYWNKGYGTEALKAVIKYLFEECDADVVNAEFMSNNPASGKVMEKAGMKFEGILRSRVIDKNNIRNDLINYSITKNEYFNMNKK